MNKTFNPEFNYKEYPEYTDAHMIPFGDDDVSIFDKDYPYIDKSKKFKWKQRLVRLGLWTIVFPFSYICLGLKIKGKENIRKNKKLLKQGALSIANHINMWDYIAVMNAIKPIKPYVLVFNKNVTGKDGPLVRAVGGIPIPESNNLQASLQYVKEVKDLLNNGGWLHIYPEGSLWKYYRHIRPFKKGVAHLARLVDKPIIPLGFSYRKPSWLRKKLFKQEACHNLCIGEPIFIDKSLPLEEQEEDLLIRCHAAVCDLVGLSVEDNQYEPIFNNSKRIDFN